MTQGPAAVDQDASSVPPALRTAVPSALISLSCILAGALVLLTVDGYPEVAQRAPRLVAWLTIATAAIVLARDVLDIRRTGGWMRLDPRPSLRSHDLRQRAVVLVTFAGLTVLLRQVHFVPVAFVALLGSSWVLGWRRPVWHPVLASILISVILYWSFTDLFRVRL